MNYKAIILDTFSWIFGILVFAIGVLNVFWGNDAGFGVFIVLLSFAFFPLINTLIKERIGFTIPLIVKILLLFINNYNNLVKTTPKECTNLHNCAFVAKVMTFRGMANQTL